MPMQECTPRLCLGLPTVPLVAWVHQLPAGFPMGCILKMLLSVIMVLHQHTVSVLWAAVPNLILVCLCFADLQAVFTEALWQSDPRPIMPFYAVVLRHSRPVQVA